ncbi:unnamed protein product [Cuscuta campestris]|uniref:Uncharacterized protein n=1 Tax=Cuscuta campestris TaxID=132261 RepID=A0A484LIX0_9ASTE|nr:unnamed protein product [Cuscuta campestris]
MKIYKWTSLSSSLGRDKFTVFLLFSKFGTNKVTVFLASSRSKTKYACSNTFSLGNYVARKRQVACRTRIGDHGHAETRRRRLETSRKLQLAFP